MDLKNGRKLEEWKSACENASREPAKKCEGGKVSDGSDGSPSKVHSSTKGQSMSSAAISNKQMEGQREPKRAGKGRQKKTAAQNAGDVPRQEAVSMQQLEEKPTQQKACCRRRKAAANAAKGLKEDIVKPAKLSKVAAPLVPKALDVETLARLSALEKKCEGQGKPTEDAANLEYENLSDANEENNFGEEMMNFKEDMKGFKDEMKNLEKSMKNFMEDMKSLKEDSKTFKEDIKSLRNGIRNFKDVMKSLKEDMKGLKDDIKNFKADMESLKEVLKSSKEDMNNFNEDLKSLKEDTMNLKADMKNFRKDMKYFNEDLKSPKDDFKS